MKILRNSDVNTDGGGSSNSANDVKPNEQASSASSTASASPSDKETLSEVVQAAYQQSVAKQEKEVSQTAKQEQQAESDVQLLNSTEKEKKEEQGEEGEQQEKETEQQQEQQDEEKTKEDKTVTKDPETVPYNRFKEVNESVKTLQSQVEEYKPVVDAHKGVVDFCEQNGISPQQFTEALQLAATINTNPSEAVGKLSALLDELQGLTGDKLPTDLQAKVNAGDMLLDDAKELARLRAEREHGTKRQQLNERQQQELRQREHMQSLANATSQWVSAKQQTDPDFRPKTSPNAVDGKMELVAAKYQALYNAVDDKGRPVYEVRTANDAVKLLDMAYKEVDRLFSTLQPKKQPVKPLTQKQTEAGQEGEPTSLRDVVNKVAAKYGININ